MNRNVECLKLSWDIIPTHLDSRVAEVVKRHPMGLTRSEVCRIMRMTSIEVAEVEQRALEKLRAALAERGFATIEDE